MRVSAARGPPRRAACASRAGRPGSPRTHWSQPCGVERIRPHATASPATAEEVPRSKLLLDAFWEARGVLDRASRRKLVDIVHAALLASGSNPLDSAPLDANVPLPGLSASWNPEAADVLIVSRRLLALYHLFGGSTDDPSSSSTLPGATDWGSVDVVWMVVREPGLLTADMSQLTARLLDMKIATFGMPNVDVTKVVEAQPALLLSDRWQVDLEALQASTSSTRSAAESAVDAWQYGISSDSDREWSLRLQQLQLYRERNGDASVGCRDGDDLDLGRWAAKQRGNYKSEQLPADRRDALVALDFQFDADEAEWCRWFSELLAFKEAHGHASPMPLVTGGDIYLINWCAIQRIARRSHVLSESRIQRMDGVGFDWSGADPLS